MSARGLSRRNFSLVAGALAGSAAVRGPSIFGHSLLPSPQDDKAADYTLKIATSSIGRFSFLSHAQPSRRGS
jgi:hypothetical protein